jgi:hypothetical protein
MVTNKEEVRRQRGKDVRRKREKRRALSGGSQESGFRPGRNLPDKTEKGRSAGLELGKHEEG